MNRVFNPDKNFCFTRHLSGTHTISTRDVQRAVAAPDKYWQVGDTIKIGFIQGMPVDINFVKQVHSQLFSLINLNVEYTTNLSESDIRIAFQEGDGSWSYIGTDALYIAKSQPTINFGWLDQAVVLHETGHALGLYHEHQNPTGGIQWNRNQVIQDLSGPPNNWSLDQIEHNVFRTHDPANVDSTPFDEHSIMLYFFPSSWVLSGPGAGNRNTELSDVDIAFLQTVYSENPNVTLTAQDIFTRERDIDCLREEHIVFLLNKVGIESTEDDLKVDNVRKLWNYINLNR